MSFGAIIFIIFTTLKTETKTIMKNKLFIAGAAILCSIASYAQPQLLEKVESNGDAMIIPYEKWKLPNGLTVIINEDHSDPIVSVAVTYKVGSSRESIGKSGFAHFFEHMMFQGSKHVGDEEHFKMISTAGGDMNGFTQNDKTVYYETVPSNNLETALWLESDRMGFLLDSLYSKKFENQRDAVKNEKGQNVENQPYGMVEELLGQTLYPFKHPYSWPVIGYTDDLNRASLDDVKNFFLRWYGPNNAILAIAGDVNPKEAMDMVVKYFGSLKPCPEVKKMKAPPVVLPTDKYASYKDNIYLPLSYRVYPTVPAYHRDQPALDILANMMGGGNNSVFYKKFEKTEIAAQAGVFHGSQELSGDFGMQVMMYPPDDYNFEKMFNRVDSLVKDALNEFEKTGITDESLQRTKAQFESGIVGSAEDVMSKGQLLSEWTWMQSKPQFNLKDELERYNKVTKEDVTRVFNKYIKGAGAAVINVYPKGMDKDSVKSFNPYAGMANQADPEYQNLKYDPPVDNFDRSKHPVPTAAKGAIVPDFYKTEFANGMKVIGTKSSETPNVVIQIQMEGGDLVLKPEEFKKVGIASMTAAMMGQSTEKYTAEQFSAELDKLGSSISFGGGKAATSITVQCLKKNTDATLKLLEEALFKPKFDEKDFKRIKKQTKESLKQDNSSASTMARKAYSSIIYGNTIWGVSPTVKTMDKLTIDDVKDYYNKYYSPNVATATIVGDINESEIMPKLDFLKNWKSKNVKVEPNMNFPVVTEPQIYVVDKPFAPQSIITAGHMSMKYDATGDYYKSNVMNYAFGGAFNSRLNLNLRENKGYTYGIRSGFSGNKYAGTFTISTSVKRKATADAVMEILKETKGYTTKGITDEELNFTKSSILNGDALNYETAFQKAGFLSEIVTNGLDKNYPKQQAEILKGMTKADVSALAAKNIDMSRMVIIIVGDKEIVKNQFDKVNVNVKDFNEKLSLKLKEYKVD